MELYSEGIAVVGIAHCKAAAADGIIKPAHMPADSNSLGGFQAHEMLDEIHALFAVAVGQLISYLVKRHFLPLAGGVVFHVAGADLVKISLAQVVQQGTDGVAFGVFALGVKMLHHRVVDVQAVHDQAALAGAVVAGGGRGREKVRGLQPAQQAVRAGARDVFIVDLHKPGAVVFHANLTVPYRSGCLSGS